MTAQHPSNTAASQQTESSNCPHFTKKERPSGLLVDIADHFHDGPVRNAVNMPSFGISFIFLPVIVILTLSAMKSGIMTGGIFFQTKKLEYFGAEIQSVVINKEAVKKENGKTENGEVRIKYDYWIIYRFQVLNLEKKEQVSKELHDQLKIETLVPIVYDRKNPAVSRVKGNYVTFSPLAGDVSPLFSSKGIMELFSILGIILFGGATVIGLLVWIIRGIIAFALLRIKGQITTAEIIELEEYDGGNSREYTMIYRFKPFGASAAITGKQTFPRYNYFVYDQRKTIDVLYLAKKPEWFKAIVIPDRKTLYHRKKLFHISVSSKLWTAMQYLRIGILGFVSGVIMVGYNIYNHDKMNDSVVVFGFLFIMFSSLVFIWNILLRRSVKKLDKYGIIANAKIVDIEEYEDNFMISYRFNVTSPDGESCSILAIEGSSVPWRKQIGDTMTVRYLEKKPTIFQLCCK